MSGRGCVALLSLVWSCNAFGQAPSIATNGVVNAASWSTPIVPGELIAIFGANLATTRQSASVPLPVTLGGTSVTINGVAAPIAFVSPTQINAQVPSSGVSGLASVVVTTAAGSSAPSLAALNSATPGLFTADGSGCGQSAALNVKPDGSISVNSFSNSAAPGESIALFGTGFGLALQQPPDGTAADDGAELITAPGVFVDGNPLPALQYWGLAPTLVGVDQINFQVPTSTRNGCAVPVYASDILASPRATISVQRGGGQCIDPPIQSYGELSMYKATFYGSGPNSSATFGEGFIGSFPSGPNVQAAAPEAIVYAPAWTQGAAGTFALISAFPIVLRTCPVPGYSDLSAGAIQIQQLPGSAFTVQPQTVDAGGVIYSQSLPAGFIAPGTYAISGMPGSAVALEASLVVGSPIQIQTVLAPGTVISSSQPITVKWTGGDPGALVRVSLYSTGTSYTYSYADAGGGSLTMAPVCELVCGFGLPRSQNAQITVEVLPNPANVANVSVPGITGSVKLTWQYSYDFSGLVLGP